AGADRLPAALASGRSVAWAVPVARLTLGAQPRVCHAPGQEPLSLFPLRRGRQCPGPMGRLDETAAARSGTRSVPTAGAARAVVARPTSRETQPRTAALRTIAEGEHNMSVP